jgi:hypothetical protein
MSDEELLVKAQKHLNTCELKNLCVQADTQSLQSIASSLLVIARNSTREDISQDMSITDDRIELLIRRFLDNNCQDVKVKKDKN